MDIFNIASALFGSSRIEESGGLSNTVDSVSAVGATASVDGSVGITMDADVTPADDVDGEDIDQTIIDVPTSPAVDVEDDLILGLTGDGPLKVPVVLANPGSGDRMQAAVTEAYDLASSVEDIAQQAIDVASATGQHFWPDDDGVHVTEVTQDEWSDSTGTSYHSGANVLLNALGQLFRDGLNNLLALVGGSTPGVAIYDGAGNDASNVVASFTGDGIVMGRTSDYHLTVDSDSLDMLNSDHLITTFNSAYNDYGTGTYAETNIIVEPNPDYDPVDNWDGVSRGAGYLRASADSMEPTSGTSNDYENVVRLAASSNSINGDTGHVFESAIQLRNSGTDGATTVDSSISLSADNLHLSYIGGQGGLGIGRNYGMVEAMLGLNCQASNDTEVVIVGEDTHPSAERVFQLRSNVAYNDTSSVYGHELVFLMKTNGISMYDYTAPGTVWQILAPSGTTDLNVLTGTVTRGAAASSWSSADLRKYGHVVMLNLNSVVVSPAINSGSTSGTIATVPAGFRPPSTFRFSVPINTTGNRANVWGVIGGGGVIQIANRSDYTIPNNTIVHICATYIVN